MGPYLISSDECIQVKEFEKNYCADVLQVVKYWTCQKYRVYLF
ncbi:hypothetical protein ACNKHV_04845 [Shigella flexneri]